MQRFIKKVFTLFFVIGLTACGGDGNLAGTQQIEGQYTGYLQAVDGENIPWDLDHKVTVTKIGDGNLKISSDVIGSFEVYVACLQAQVCLNGDMVNIDEIINPDLHVIEVKEVVFTNNGSGHWSLVIQYVSVDTEVSTEVQVNQFVSVREDSL